MRADAAKTPATPPKSGRFGETWRLFRRNRPAVFGLILVAVLFGVALLGPLLLPLESAIKMAPAERRLPPGGAHPFGTDIFGRDLLARMINGARVSLTMGFLPTAGSLLAGMLLGALAAYRGGWIDNAVMRVCDILTCVPGILLSLTFVMILGTGLNNVLIAITVAAIPAATRYVRAVVLNIVGLDYIEAGRACGTGTFGIIRKHVLPNAFGPLLLFATSNISAMLLMGAGLSFLGLGIQPPYPEWGSMLNEAREYVLTEPWLFLFPGVAIMISMLAFNLVGDALRDALDPKLRR